jgi:predicted PurR-regulated permease PerM
MVIIREVFKNVDYYPPQVPSPGWTARTKRLVLLICLLLFGLLMWQLSDALPLVLVAVILAYLLNPMVVFFEQRILSHGPLSKKANRSLAVALTFVVVVSVIIIILLVVVPVLVGQFEEFGGKIPGLLRNLEESVEEWLSQPIIINGEPFKMNGEVFIPLERLREATGNPSDDVFQLENLDLMPTIQGFIGTVTSPAVSVVGGALTALINLIFLVTLMSYLMNDGPRFAEHVIAAAPPDYRNDARRLLQELALVWDAYLRGQLLLCLIIGVLVFIAATLLGVPNALILGLISALFEFIPAIGPALALFPAVLLALSSQSSTLPFLEGTTFALVVAVVRVSLQHFHVMVIVPRVMGRRLNLHPFMIIVALIAGASLGGALGIVLAAPALASARVLGHYIYGKLTDQNPFSEPRPDTMSKTDGGVLVRQLWDTGTQWLQQRLSHGLRPADHNQS